MRLITSGNKSCGTFITPYLPGKFRPTPIKNDGTRYRWTLDYDPEAAGGNGQFTFTMQSDRASAARLRSTLYGRRERGPRPFSDYNDISRRSAAGYKADGASFDRFGMHNMMKGGGGHDLFRRPHSQWPVAEI